ncbi:MAG TPA: SDR family NAD(P)-dependent oxidoreductase [Blastocatellia bacterium]|nr:SDR family NAD(P)-dependent oxidoreductase [Blastocatellia bacterium]
MSDIPAFDAGDEIAIIGMAGRFPKAKNLDEFWRNLCDGAESISFFSSEELLASGVDPALIDNPNYVKARGILEDIDRFDAHFFGFSPREAEMIDPQQRIFLECAWEALENAGYDPERCKEIIGVYAGASFNTYSLFNLFANRRLMDSAGFYQTMMGSDKDYLTTRVSYKLNLKGPSVDVQTACSTSLVAVHMACQSLLNGECDLALAGGASIMLLKKEGYLYQEGGIFSPDGHCRAFDAKARGCVDGSGVGVVVLKCLEDALESGDHIHAVIKGSAINNDGALKAGYTAPSVRGQAAVIKEAFNAARVRPETISYIEAHGTGTILGDPIEIAALAQAFQASDWTNRFCAIGSVKTNMGHLDAAAGIAGLIKTVLALKHKTLPPSLHFQQPNPQIDFDNSPFYVNAKLAEWHTDRLPRRAGVSSFGIGGTNAHVIVEEAPPRPGGKKQSSWQLLLLSAKTRSALETATMNLAHYLKAHTELRPADVAYTLQVGRRAFGHRRMLVCRDLDDAATALETMNLERVHTRSEPYEDRPVAFMFPGQGAQHPGMTSELYEEEPTFREQVDACSEHLKPHLGFDLRDVLYPRQPRASAEEFNETFVTQPMLFVVEYALAKLWIERGVQPRAMIGHSIGEYVAACLAGVFSLEDALSLVASRGRLMQKLPKGSMLAVMMAEERLLKLLGEGLSLAAVNGPSRCVASGPTEAIDGLQIKLVEMGVECRRLHTSHAFHSAMMDPLVGPFTARVAKVSLQPPSIPYVSNITGDWITAAEATDPAYWARHLRQPVRFDAGLAKLLSEPNLGLLEVGPGQGLSSLARRHPGKTDGQIVCSSLCPPGDGSSEVAFLLNTLGRLWMSGVEINWAKLHAGQTPVRVPLPTYPFESERYWIEPENQAVETVGERGSNKRLDVDDSFYATLWKQSVPPASAAGADAPSQKFRWLVLCDGCGLGSKIVERLDEIGQDVISVSHGEQFAAVGDHAFEINPHLDEDYTSLFNQLRAANKIPQTIIHLWGVTSEDAEQQETVAFIKDQALGFNSLISIARAIGDCNILDPIKLAVVSNSMQSVAGEAKLFPLKATVLGPCKVIHKEYPNVTCHSIDVTIGESGIRRKLIDQLVAELRSESSDVVVALRDNKRWVQDFEPVRIAGPGEHNSRLREGGVYLITGGLGGLGLEFAHYLARKVKAKLILLGRSAFPERDEWEQHLSNHDEQNGTSRKIRKIRELEAAGAEVLIVSADVSDRGQMQKSLRLIGEKFGAINGVIHAAGVAGGGMIQTKTAEAAMRVLAPKVSGTVVLDSLLKGADLDFFILCSSLTSILGGFGQVDYCAANAFLDAFAHYKASRSDTFTVSVNWDAWQETGMAVKAPDPSQAEESQNTVYEKADHPLFDKYIAEGAGKERYVTEFSPQTHWVLDEHRIVGNPVIPGTTYLEMARAALERPGEHEGIQIRDVYFVTPLMIRDGEMREVHTLLEEGDGSFRFSIKSRGGSGNGTSSEWQEHALGTVEYENFKPTGKYQIDSLIKRCNEREVTLSDQEQEDDGPRWRALKKVYVGNNELIAALELQETYSGDLEKFRLHPSLLDVATGAPKQYLGDGSAYLPLSYKRVAIKRPLSRKVYSYARYKEDGFSTKETMTFDLVILDEDGNELVEIEEFTAKKVNDAALKIRAWSDDQHKPSQKYGEMAAATAQGEAHPASPASSQSRPGQGLLSEEGVEAFGRILNSSPAPQIAVSMQDLRLVIEQANESAQSQLLESVGELQQPALKSIHHRPDVQTEYVAPRNELERKLAELWQELLGFDQIGIHDNFFELGGDSVLAIQVISRANKLGLRITPQQIFQNQTIAALTAMLDKADAPEAAQDFVTGAVPLTPSQQAFYENNDSAHWRHSRALLLEAQQPLNEPLLKSDVEFLFKHHDALRIRFQRTSGGWQQINAATQIDTPFSKVDLSNISDAEKESAIENVAASLRLSLDLSEGPILRIALLELGPRHSSYLLLVGHDLVVDDQSWQILINDLAAAYGQLSRGQSIELPSKTASFKHCAEQLIRHAGSGTRDNEANFWLDEPLSQAPPLPVDYPVNAREEKSTRTISLTLSVEETRALLEDCTAAYHMRVDEVLLTALAEAVSAWAGSRSLLVDLTNSWREGSLKDVDASQTIGNFTFTSPVLLDLEEASGPGQALKTVKEQIRRMPDRGLAYGLIRYAKGDSDMAANLRACPEAQLSFNHTGEALRVPTGVPFKPSQKLMSGLHQPLTNQHYLLGVNSFIVENRLEINWTYDESLYRRSTIEHLIRCYEDSLQSLVCHCQSVETAHYTASDFPLAKLDERKLNKLAALLNSADEA